MERRDTPSQEALRVAKVIVTKPSVYGKAKKRKKADCRAADHPPSDSMFSDDWRVGLDLETPQTGDKPA